MEEDRGAEPEPWLPREGGEIERLDVRGAEPEPWLRDGEENDPLEVRGARVMVGAVIRGEDVRGSKNLGTDELEEAPPEKDGRFKRDEEAARELGDVELS